MITGKRSTRRSTSELPTTIGTLISSPIAASKLCHGGARDAQDVVDAHQRVGDDDGLHRASEGGGHGSGVPAFVLCRNQQPIGDPQQAQLPASIQARHLQQPHHGHRHQARTTMAPRCPNDGFALQVGRQAAAASAITMALSPASTRSMQGRWPARPTTIRAKMSCALSDARRTTGRCRKPCAMRSVRRWRRPRSRCAGTPTCIEGLARHGVVGYGLADRWRSHVLTVCQSTPGPLRRMAGGDHPLDRIPSQGREGAKPLPGSG